MVIKTFGFPIAVGTIDENPQNYTYDYSGWYYFTVVLFSLFAVLGITAVVYFKKNKKDRYSIGEQMLQAFSFT
jgi:hypothetical protein